ncbi:hypothetical protein [Natrinema salsiterrestre]|uniref:Uncharacterized protein n=1 Tax=Natrinema salsiterrestre TaxID=2950540 RepID=A0A9Q4L408_9EURY|nr:hypothetical protein [Natrinema salsiterrestre]MDF9747906.1 hypothetical protein [Natrinema salsiterrestre]
MFTDQHRDDLLTAVALAEFSYRRQRDTPRLDARSWQLAVNHLSKYGIEPYEAVDALRADDKRNADAEFEIRTEMIDAPIREGPEP